MNGIVQKLKGDGAALPPLPSGKSVLLAWSGGSTAIALVAILTDLMAIPWLLGSFGASCVLMFGFPDAAFSQPRNVIAGHFISSLVGVVFLTIFGPHWWAVAMAVGTSIAIMMLTRTVHPPAGSNPVIVFLTQPGWSFVLFPTLVGSLALVAITLIFNNVTRDSRYPKYW